MKIAVDIDEVLSHLFPKVVEYFNNLHNTNYVVDECKAYSWCKAVNIPKEQEMVLYNSFIEAGGLKTLSVVKGAKDGINKIKDNHQLVVVTSRALTLKEDTEFWLNKHFPGCFKEVIYLRKTIFDRMLENKFAACQKANVDLIIEDNLEHLDEFAGKEIEALIFDRPWNRNMTMPKNFCRVNSWEEITNIVNS